MIRATIIGVQGSLLLNLVAPGGGASYECL
jgi:hypothetical protein